MIPSSLKKAYVTARTLLGARGRLIARIKRDNLLPVLSLHQVRPDGSPYWPAMHPDTFEALLRYLMQHFDITHFGAPKQDKPPLILSFDDGTADFMSHVYPLLHKYQLRANLNIIPAAVETGEPPWNLKLYDFLKAAPADYMRTFHVPGFQCQWHLKQKEAYGLKLSRFLKMQSRQKRQAIWTDIEKSMSQLTDIAYTPMMSRSDVLAAATHCDIGAHSYTHESMAYESDAYFEADVARCRHYFEQTLGQPMHIYAFPNGSYKPKQPAYLQQQSVRYILGVGDALATDSQGFVPRINLYGQSANEIILRALGGFVR